jgi:hypothetical protein
MKSVDADRTAINPVCAFSGCERRVFSDREIARGVHLTIAADFCEDHEIDDAGRIRQPNEVSA